MQDRSENTAQQELSDLWELRRLWRDTYHCALVDGVWRAKRWHDVTHVITADSAEALCEKIQADYDAMATP